jgi:hypothetical protein
LNDFNVAFDSLGNLRGLNSDLLIKECLEIFLVHGQCLGCHKLRNLGFKPLTSLLIGGFGTLLANVGPRKLNRGYGSFVDSLNVGLDQLDPLETTHNVPINTLRLDVPEYLLPQVVHLVHKFGTKLFQWEIFQVLKFFFIGQGPNHCATLSIFKVGLKSAANLILLVIMRPLFSESTFQVLLLCQVHALFINKL